MIGNTKYEFPGAKELAIELHKLEPEAIKSTYENVVDFIKVNYGPGDRSKWEFTLVSYLQIYDKSLPIIWEHQLDWGRWEQLCEVTRLNEI